MNAFLYHFLFEFYSGFRNKNLLLLNYLFPLGFFLLMGFIMPSINPPFREVIIPAMVIFSVLSATLLGIPDPLVNDREKGVFRSYKINGVPKASILAIPALTTMLHSLIVIIVITIVAPLLFDAPAPVNWLNYIIISIAFIFSCSGISVLIGVCSSNSRMTVLWSQIFFIPSMLLSGLMIPFSFLPETAGVFARLLPATYAMNAFNSLAMGNSSDFSPWGSVVVLITSGVLAYLLSSFLFSWDRQNTTRRAHPGFSFLVLIPFIIGMIIL